MIVSCVAYSSVCYVFGTQLFPRIDLTTVVILFCDKETGFLNVIYLKYMVG